MKKLFKNLFLLNAQVNSVKELENILLRKNQLKFPEEIKINKKSLPKLLKGMLEIYEKDRLSWP